MAKVSVVVCDVCGGMTEEAPLTWAIHGPSKTYRVDLCEEHHEGLADAIEKALPGYEPRRTVHRPRKGFTERVMTISEIEALKGA